MSFQANKVLIVTGSLLSEKETSLWQAIRKQYQQWKASQSAWLDLKVKVTVAEFIISALSERKGIWGRSRVSPQIQNFFSNTDNFAVPELTEVLLATLLEREGIPYESATYADLFTGGKKIATLLANTDCVFASTTLLRDLSEVEPLVAMLKRSHNKIVLGGALTGSLCHWWQGMTAIDVVAVGYGELLMPQLAAWIRSGYEHLEAPPGGRIVAKEHSTFLHSGAPVSRDLDFLETPDWGLPQYRKDLRMLYYESVRGCPYRCNFCNYPYLFDDDKFRYKSAQKMADDWEYYSKELGVEYITCLDSLFTMPRRRLREFCEQLIERDIRVKWICYARADDLADEDTVRLMKRAGVHQVQIGIESGVQHMLDNMDKACTVASNAAALANCRRWDVTSVVTLIVGFPGETEETLDATYQFLAKTPPDFYYLATFSTRIAEVPVLNEANRQRFGLLASDNPYTVAPYWQHHTMSCAEVGNHVRKLNYRLMANGVSLNAALFYGGILSYQQQLREELLLFQKNAVTKHPLVVKIFDYVHLWVDKHLRQDVEKWLATSKPMNQSIERRAPGHVD